MFKKAYTFDDVALVPQYNNIASRTTPDLSTWLTKDTKINIPLIASNMDTVICDDLAKILVENGSMPIFHRFCPFEEQATLIQKYKEKCFFSCGLGNLEEVVQLYDMGAKGVCIDIAHGHSDRMLSFIRSLKSERPEIEIIAGNVCTPMAYQDLVSSGADSVKIGVGPGAACTTRMTTGFGVPQFSAIYDCAQVAKKLRVPIIADGGIRNSRDVVLALAAGASSVMIGSLFSKTYESPCEKFYYDKDSNSICSPATFEANYNNSNFKCFTKGPMVGKYRGQASKDFQEDFYGEVKKGTVPEGIAFYQTITTSAQGLINELCGGLRSGLTYSGSASIKELQRKCEIVEVSATYMPESKPRPEIENPTLIS